MKKCLIGAGALLAGSALVSPVFAAPSNGIETVVVTASPFAQQADKFATIVSAVDRDQILQSGASNIGDVLKDVPGVSATGFAAGASRPVLRGMDAERVRILEDGLSSSDVSDIGPDHGVPIDPLAAQSVEVVRGAATLRYGSQAIGGVVNIINNRVPMSLPDEPLTGDFTASYGSNADMNQESAMFDGKLDDFAFHLDGFARRANNYDTPDGEQQNSFNRTDGISGGGSYFLTDRTHFGGAIMHYDAKYGIPSDTTYIDMHQTKYLTRSAIALDLGPLQSVNIDTSYADYKHTEIDPTTGPEDTFLDEEWDVRSETLWGPMGPFSNTAVGYEFTNRNFSALGDASSYLNPTHTVTNAGFLFTEIPVGSRVRIQAGGRVEHVSVQGTPASGVLTNADFTPVSGSIGALFDATDWLKLGLTVSSAARAPAQTELFAHGGHDGPDTFETGDPTLGLERANSIEGTLRVERQSVQFEGSVWATKFNGYIYGDLTGLTCEDDGTCGVGIGDLKQLFYRQQDATFWGLEGKADVPLGRVHDGALTGELIGDYVRATFDHGGNVPRIPPYKVGAGLYWSNDAFDLNANVYRVGRQSDIAATETITKGYISLDAGITWRPFQDRPSVELSLTGHNLTNAVERDATSFNKDDIEQPGRDVQLTLHVKT